MLFYLFSKYMYWVEGHSWCLNVRSRTGFQNGDHEKHNRVHHVRVVEQSNTETMLP